MKATGSRSKWRWLLRLVAVSVFVAPVLAIAYAYYTTDEPPPYDADLALASRVVPAGENGFVTLMALSEKDVFWPNGDETVEGYVFSADQLDSMTRGEAWDGVAARKLLERNAKALGELDRALAQDHFVDTGPQNMEESSRHDWKWHRLYYTQQVRTWSFFHEGSEREALRAAINLARFGAKLEASRGPVFRCEFGTSFKDVGVKLIETICLKWRLAPGDLAQLANALRELVTPTDVLADAVRVEYEMQISLLEDIWTGKIDVELIYDPAGVNALIAWGGRSLCFKPNHTKRLFAEFSRALIAKLEGKDASPKPVDVFQVVDGPVDSRWPARNVVGRLYAQSTLSMLQAVVAGCRQIDERILALADSLAR